MTRGPKSLDQIAKASHRTTLVLLAVCAIVVALHGEAGSDSPPPLDYTITAVALAVASVVCRQFSTSPVMRASIRMPLTLLAHALAALVGAVAVALAIVHGERENALLFTLGAAILSLRPPSSMAERPDGPRR